MSAENEFDPDFSDTSDHVLIAISKYQNQTHRLFSVLGGTIPCISMYLQFQGILKKTKNLVIAETSQQTDVSVRILPQNSENFAKYFHRNRNYCLNFSIIISLLSTIN